MTMNEKPIYLSGLNGLRAIAALSVVIAHVSEKGLADFGLPFLFELPMAGYGVTLFFVISGFLITYLLLKEKNTKQKIDIKKFYVRRILRIWPLYYLLLIVTLLYFLFLHKAGEIFVKELWFYIFFAANIPFIFQNGILILVHYWSIGVEEQFYLIWPWLIRFARNKLLILSVIIFLILFTIKIALWFWLGTASYPYRFIMVTRFHCMMVGAIGAIVFFQQKMEIVNLLSNKFVQLISWILFILMGLNVIQIPAVIGQEIIAAASLSMILGQVTINNRLINLETKIFDFVGKISYGIYVIHPLIILILSGLYKNLNIYVGLRYLLVYSSVIAFTLLFSWIIYTYFEMPFLRLKKKHAIIQSSNSMFQ